MDQKIDVMPGNSGQMKWELFFTHFKNGNIIPIIGNDLSLMKNGKGEIIPLYDYMAERLAHDLKIPYKNQNFHEIALGHYESNIQLFIQNIYKKIDENEFYQTPLEKLAEITDFQFYITTAIDDLLLKAIAKQRNLPPGKIKVMNYSPRKLSSCPLENGEKPEVSVFHLCGSLGNVVETAVDEEEILEHFFSIAQKGNDKPHPQLEYLFQQLENKILLFIGCSFPDWFMRFIIRTLTGQRFKDSRLHTFFVDNKCKHTKNLHEFLSKFKSHVVFLKAGQVDNPQEFVNVLYDKWKSSVETVPRRYEGTVFLSYFHKDLKIVREFNRDLMVKGINVWFDEEDLQTGKHKDIIENEIKKCSVFLPIISHTCLENPQGYNRRVEWTAAELRLIADEYYGKKTFHIIPCIVDDTARNDPRIPGFLRQFTIKNPADEKEKIIEEIIEGLKPLQNRLNR